MLSYNRCVDWYEAEVRDLEKGNAARAVKCPVVFYGSSSIRLWTTLAEDLGSKSVLNAGFGGSTLEACAYFFERLVVASQPASLVVYAGDNDLGDGRTPADVLRYFRDLSRKASLYLPGIPFGFISIKPSPARAGITDRIRQTNEMIAGEIRNMPGAYYIDVFSAMLDVDGKPCPDLFQEDGLHLNSSGYRLWTEIILNHRDNVFAEDRH